MNFGVIIIAVVFLFACLYSLRLLYEAIVEGVRRWISDREMRRRGLEPALVCHEDELAWVATDCESAMPDKSVCHSEVGQVEEKKLDMLPEPRLDVPSKAELDRLKKRLHVTSGSLFYKHGAVYVVTSEKKKRYWKWLGRWKDLKRELDE